MVVVCLKWGPCLLNAAERCNKDATEMQRLNLDQL